MAKIKTPKTPVPARTKAEQIADLIQDLEYNKQSYSKREKELRQEFLDQAVRCGCGYELLRWHAERLLRGDCFLAIAAAYTKCEGNGMDIIQATIEIHRVASKAILSGCNFMGIETHVRGDAMSVAACDYFTTALRHEIDYLGNFIEWHNKIQEMEN